MGLPWVRLDTQFPSNPKVLELTQDGKWRSLFVWLASLAYAGIHESDGYIPNGALPFIHAVKQNATDLVKVGLWEQDTGGWRIHDWEHFQQSSEETRERRGKYRDLANRRWHPEWFE